MLDFWSTGAGNELSPVTSVDLGSACVMSSACRVLESELEVITQSCLDQGVMACWRRRVGKVQVHRQAWCSTWLGLKSLKSRRAREKEKGCVRDEFMR